MSEIMRIICGRVASGVYIWL